ncbi:MAG: tRNA (adenosine(37)-N6)-threonylcarbamoyltransferase complex dimerization subunit type 1 TsaB, partial [Planctomycetes bacterium]|nr:tRNA (adenosine(37)-N6)-threonylcarbamoyltransferase complex dimerization subunit type 1 TsaB [Planctomycetota bacterium]
MANILAIESSGNTGGAAVLREGQIVGEASLPTPRSHGEHLVPSFAQALEAAGLSFPELDGIALNVGAGSYTGLRVGLAAAEMLALVHNKPILPVPCTNALCEAAIRQGVAAGLLLPALDARRDYLVGAAFRWDGQTLARESDDELMLPEHFFAQGGVVIGDAAQIYAETLGPSQAFDGRWELEAADVGLAALRLYRSAMDASALAQNPTRRVELN